MKNKAQHFVSRHYLRQFAINGSERVNVTIVDPYRHIGAGAIEGQCQEDYFYGKDSELDDMLTSIESNIAPALVDVTRMERWTNYQLQCLRLLAVELHLRTRKAAKAAKVFPKFVADRVLESAIANGELPPPPDGMTSGMIDFEGVPGMLLSEMLSLFLETGTLAFKLLAAPERAFFITSDHPVVLLNRFAADPKSLLTRAGFAQAGFQLVVPLSPTLCGFFYDPGVYKVGDRRTTTVPISISDVELVNSLQVQSAETCLYSHEPAHESVLRGLVMKYGRYRRPITDVMRQFPSDKEGEKLLLVGQPQMTLLKSWTFCAYRRKIARTVGERRDPLFTRMIMELEADIEDHPGKLDIPDRIRRIISRIPVKD